MDYELRIAALEAQNKVLSDTVTKLEELVMGRNKSAPTKRNMTDADARRVLVGDLAEQGHKEAGEVAGLTYSQVYSARMQFTFKHIWKELRDSRTPCHWKK